MRDGDCDESHNGTERERCGCPRSTHGLQHVRHVRGAVPDRGDGRGRSGGLAAGQSARQGHRRQPLREGFGRPGARVRRRPAAADAADPHGPAWRRPVAAGVLGRGPRLHRRQAARDDRGVRRARHRALRSRRPLQRPDPDLRAARSARRTTSTTTPAAAATSTTPRARSTASATRGSSPTWSA